MNKKADIKIYTEEEVDLNHASGDFVLKDDDGKVVLKINISSIVHIVCNKDEVNNNIGGDLSITTKVTDAENGLHNEFHELSFNNKAFEKAQELVGIVKNKGVIINHTNYDHAIYTLAL